MKHTVLILAFFICFTQVNGFCKGKQEPGNNQAMEHIAELKDKINLLEKEQASIVESLEEIKQMLPDLSKLQQTENSNKSDNRSSNEVNPNTGVQYHGNILGTGFLKPDAVDVIIAYIKSQNPSVNIKTAKDLINTYFKEAKVEEVNPDIAIAQMLYATDNLRNERMRTHNYAGLSTEGVRWGGSFSTMSQGVRAHIQHLKGYASIKPLNGYTEDDPRFKLLNDLGYRGRATTFDQLFKFWAPYSPDYRNKINRILKDLYRFV